MQNEAFPLTSAHKHVHTEMLNKGLPNLGKYLHVQHPSNSEGNGLSDSL